MLGGGDLDGDVYNLIRLDTHPEFRPARTCEAASYAAAPRKVLDRPANMDDVADFVLDFMSFDVRSRVGGLCRSLRKYVDIGLAGSRYHRHKLAGHRGSEPGEHIRQRLPDVVAVA